MKIALVGYGKMGKEIEKILLERGHQVVAKIDSKNLLTKEIVKGVDVAIEFSTPAVVLDNLQFLIENQIPTVVGTTGWNKSLEDVTKWVAQHQSALIHASNFSIGVNLFFELNKKLAQLMAPHPEYQAEVTEIHHTQKLDAPSGTAITLTEDLLKIHPHYENWYCDHETSSHLKTSDQDLEIKAIRAQDVKGTHLIKYQSEIDEITIEHKAFSRKGFALGAVIAAEWLQNKKGIFTMKDVLQLSKI